MAELKILASPKGFKYDPTPQRTKGWYDRRLGKRTASRLKDWLKVSKSEKTLGQPLKPRLDYEKELLFEQVFNVSYNNYVSEAMDDGRMLEKFAISQYAKVKNVLVYDVGCWYNDFFAASPDGGIDENGIVEAKVVRDNTFSELIVAINKVSKKGVISGDLFGSDHFPKELEDGKLGEWWKQMQGQLWASGREWCDFIVINMATKKILVVRVMPDLEFHKWLELSVPEPLIVDRKMFDSKNVFDFVDEAPEYTEIPGEFKF